MFQESEVVNLLVGLGSAVVVALLARRIPMPKGGLLYGGFGSLLLGYAFTVLEGFAWPEALNFAEHLCYAAAGVLFLAFVVGAAAPRAADGGSP